MNERKGKVVADDLVIHMDYTLTVDGEEVDSSKEDGPLEFLQGRGNIIPGLESELYGMAVGESKDVTVTAADAYGEFDEEQVVDVSREEFPAEIPLEIGTELEVREKDGDVLSAMIVEVDAENVTLDFNHPLAGEDLQFHVTIVGIRPATREELAHGHVHDEGHAH